MFLLVQPAIESLEVVFMINY